MKILIIIAIIYLALMIYGFLGALLGILTSVINEVIDVDFLSALTSEIWEDYPKMWIACWGFLIPVYIICLILSSPFVLVKFIIDKISGISRYF